MTVLVVGEALVDLILSPDGSIEAVPGGGPFNAARTIGRLGVDVSFGGGISDDAFGRRIAGLLAQDGVSAPVPTRVGLPTTLALAELDEGGAATYRFYSAGTSGAELHPGDVVIGDDVTVLSVGTLGLVLEPIASTIEGLVSGVGEEVLVFLDPNARPGNIPDDALYRARLAHVLTRADVVKVSGDDLDYLDPSAAPLDAARTLLDAGPQVVLFTDGGGSVVVLASGGGELTVPVPPVVIVDTVGAGDAFGGAFLAFWVSAGNTRHDLSDLDKVRAAVERAIVVAGITCQRPGADPPHLSELPAW